MRNILGAFALAFGVGATISALSPKVLWHNPTRDQWVADSPCALMGPAMPLLLDGEPHLVYTCVDGQVIVRGFLRDQRVPPPVTFTPSSSCAHIPGFVPARLGGCVPPNHPDALER
jgi:hypothetical protein